MADTEEEYNAFVHKQADKYTAFLKTTFKEAMDYHRKNCDAPTPLNFICARHFLDHFMDDFQEELSRRQSASAHEQEQADRQIKKTEEDILTYFFGPPFDPRNN
jgi:hypothetical protein